MQLDDLGVLVTGLCRGWGFLVEQYDIARFQKTCKRCADMLFTRCSPFCLRLEDACRRQVSERDINRHQQYPWWAVSAGYLGDFLLRGRDTALKEECPND